MGWEGTGVEQGCGFRVCSDVSQHSCVGDKRYNIDAVAWLGLDCQSFHEFHLQKYLFPPRHSDVMTSYRSVTPALPLANCLLRPMTSLWQRFDGGVRRGRVGKGRGVVETY